MTTPELGQYHDLLKESLGNIDEIHTNLPSKDFEKLLNKTIVNINKIKDAYLSFMNEKIAELSAPQQRPQNPKPDMSNLLGVISDLTRKLTKSIKDKITQITEILEKVKSGSKDLEDQR